ncbi:Cytosol aminopeptidase [Mycoplasmopsis pulmonis]|nr:Cytosol aminopeptidase [Mycoplasmopsis pulmonis]
MIKVSNEKEFPISLKLIFKQENMNDFLIQEDHQITEINSENTLYYFVKDKSKYDIKFFKKAASKIVENQNRNLNIDISSFSHNSIALESIVKIFVEKYEFKHANLFKEKDKDDKQYSINLYVSDKQKILVLETLLEKTLILTNALNTVRKLQIYPPNICNSEWLADFVYEDLKKIDSLKINIYNKSQIEDLGMNLFLSVNKGSAYEPRLVSIEYNGDPSSEEKTVLVGKGITFDSGGYNIKTSHMGGMKFDMSGAAIAAYALKAMAQLRAKSNFAALMLITDNRLNSVANIPDSVWKSMNGKTVEVTDTDAEGRLVLADGITFAIRKLNATRVITIATLTGTILYTLGTSYTGGWATNNKTWKELLSAAKKHDEPIWRLPLNEDYIESYKKSKVADLVNWSSASKPDSNSAAMFLKEFTEEKDFVHLDIAGTAEIEGEPQGVLVKTLAQLALDI